MIVEYPEDELGFQDSSEMYWQYNSDEQKLFMHTPYNLQLPNKI